MISCTEFIPLYSEFFKFLDAKGGHDAVVQYWHYLSDNGIGDKTNPNSLVSFVERDGGFEGAVNYWTHTLTEEACDLLKVHDYVNKCSYSHMRHCPSRGMLNELKHIEPYYDYCGHCNVIYTRVLDKYGIVHEMDHSKIDNAECFSVLYEKGKKPDFDYTKVEEIPVDETKVVVNMKSEDNKYLHRDFHLSGDMALKYCGEQFGEKEVIRFLTEFTKKFYAPKILEIKKDGLIILKTWIEKIYETEEALEVLHTELQEEKLTVTIDKCPVIEYMRSLNQEPSRYYVEETRTLYSTIAEECGFSFEMVYYKEDGATQFVFYDRCSV